MSVHIPFDSYHPNLALVHRQSGITEYVLKDTGQVVGDENYGISPLWQGLLGCNDRGDKDDERMEEFWKDWETSCGRKYACICKHYFFLTSLSRMVSPPTKMPCQVSDVNNKQTHLPTIGLRLSPLTDSSSKLTQFLLICPV